jgi:hypothetical protein
LKGLGQGYHCCFGGDVDRHVGGHLYECREGCGVDYVPAFAVLADTRHERLHAIDDAAEIHGHAEVPVVVSRFLERAFEADAGIVDDDVQVAEDALGLIRCRSHGGTVGHVQLDRMHALDVAVVLEAHRGGLDVIRPQIREHDVHARPDECFRDAEADAARATRDERGLACEVLHVCPLRFSPLPR